MISMMLIKKNVYELFAININASGEERRLDDLYVKKTGVNDVIRAYPSPE